MSDGAVYQTINLKEANLLKELGFKYTKEHKIYEFEYSIELGMVLDELRLEK